MTEHTLKSKEVYKPRGYQEPILEAIIAHCKKKVAAPAFVDISVGGGKTAIYAFIANHVVSKGGKALILARQGELVEQNSNFAWDAGFNNSVYCASLSNKKSTHYPIVYGSEGTIANAIGEGQKMGYTVRENGSFDFTWIPSILMIDECHQVNFKDPENQYMKIINFFMAANPKLRIIGGTGSPIRGKEYIVGEFWSERLYELPTSLLVEWGWLVPPIFGFPEDLDDGYDFSSIEVDKDGDSFKESDLDEIIDDPTLTHKIINEIVARTTDRLGVLIFCSTKRHCKEVCQALPKDSYGVITDSTGFKERRKILSQSRSGEIKFLVNVGVLATGYNNPRIDTVCYLRPLDSLTLLIQTLGRGLRIPEDHDDFIKTNCLILDYADVFARLGDLYENPILEEAMKQGSKRKGEIRFCPECDGENSMMARRCINQIITDNNFNFNLPQTNIERQASKKLPLDPETHRCEYFFSSRACPICETQNDPCARECRECKHQLIDPNAKLSNTHYTEKDIKDVESMVMKPCKNNGLYIIYTLVNGEVAKEFFSPFSSNKIANRIYKSTFVNVHVKPEYMTQFRQFKSVEQICNSMGTVVMIPKQMTHRINDKKKSIINRKIF